MLLAKGNLNTIIDVIFPAALATGSMITLGLRSSLLMPRPQSSVS
jgi:hypothetical protein